MTTLDLPTGSGTDQREVGDSTSSGDGDERADDALFAEGADTTGSPADELDLDEIFELLKNDRRRMIIGYLKEQADGAATTDELATYVASRENDVPVEAVSSSQRKRVYIALYQCHLPKMDHLGVVDFAKSRGEIELRNTTPLDPYLADPAAADDDRTDLAIAAAVTVVVAIGLTGVGVLAAVPVVLWTALSVAALLWVAIT